LSSKDQFVVSISEFFRSSVPRLGLLSAKGFPRFRHQASIFLISAGLTLLLLTGVAYRWIQVEQRRLLADGRTNDASLASSQLESETAILTIPKIHLRAAILDGTSPKVLLLAPGHLQDTVLPGNEGNAVIAGHRDTFFRHIHDLQIGDDILVARGGRQIHFEVVNKFIVNPEDVSATSPTSDTRLTLITCYPTYYIGPAPRRLIVVATLKQSLQNKPATLLSNHPIAAHSQ